jgi:hypothetical protein
MMADLRDMGMRLAVASNRPGASPKLRRAGLEADFVIDRALVHANKGSTVWVERALQEFGIEQNELVWLGDTDNDMRSAVNGGVIYFHAGWSVPNYAYGIHLAEPSLMPLYLQEFFQKPTPWYWQFNGTDRQGWHITAKALMDANGAGIPVLRNDLIRFLKEGSNPHVGPVRMQDFIFLHFVGSMFSDPLYRRVDIWTAYPSSGSGVNSTLNALATLIARIFRDRYFGDLLVRHTRSIDSGEARTRREQVDFYNQSNTVRVNPNRRQRIQGRCIAVMDDFATRGYSGECARQLLLEAGAAEVVCVNVGKYGPDYWTISRTTTDYAWNPCEVTGHSERSFQETRTAGQTDQTVLTMIRESYQRMNAWRRR